MDNARSMAGYLNLTMTHDPVSKTASPYGFLTICSTLAWALGYFGMPHILLRFMAIEDHNKLKLSRRIAVIWVVIAMGVGSASETIIVCVSDLLSKHGCLAAIVAGIVLSGILAATMSTADSQLLAASSSISHNLLGGFFRVNISEKAAMQAARVSVLAISVIAAFIARDPNSSVFGIVSFAWAGFGAAFGPVVLTALFWRRSNKQGALAGMIVGGVMVFVWKYLIRPMGGIWGIYELLPAFLLALAAIIIVSLATQAPEQAVLEEYDAVTKELKNEK